MAKLSDLISRTSEVTGIPFATVQEVGRRLREGGLIQTGKGGRYGGTDMTPDDAASLLTALLVMRASSVSLGQIVRLTRSHLRDLRSYSPGEGRLVLDTWDQTLALPRLSSLKKGHTFGDALAALIGSVSNGNLKKAIADWAASRPHGVAHYFRFSVSIIGPRPFSEAQIEFDTAAGIARLDYLRRRDMKKFKIIGSSPARKLRDVLESASTGFNLAVTAAIAEETLIEIGQLLSEAS
jgi:hypothetical protein